MKKIQASIINEKSFKERYNELNDECWKTIKSLKEKIVIKPKEELEIVWSDCDGELTSSTAIYSLDSEWIYLADNVEHDIDDESIEEDINVVGYYELTTASLCDVADFIKNHK